MRPYVHARTGILTSEVSAGRAGRAAEGRKERRRRGRWKGDDAGTRQRQVAALLWLPAAAESARARRGASDGQGENERFLEGRGPGRPRGPAQPVGRLESERAGWGGRKGRVVRPKNDQRAAAPFHPHRYRFFQLSVQPRAERQTITGGRRRGCGRRKLAAAAMKNACAFFAFGPPLPRVSGGPTPIAEGKKKGSTATQDGGANHRRYRYKYYAWTDQLIYT